MDRATPQTGDATIIAANAPKICRGTPAVEKMVISGINQAWLHRMEDCRRPSLQAVRTAFVGKHLMRLNGDLSWLYYD